MARRYAHEGDIIVEQDLILEYQSAGTPSVSPTAIVVGDRTGKDQPPGAVVAANTFSSSGLYPSESATYASVFGKFYNIKAANRVIWAQNGPLAPLMPMDAADLPGASSGM